MDYKVLLEKAIPPLLAAILGAMGGSASRTVTDAEHEATVQHSREHTLENEAKIEMLRNGFHQRADLAEKEHAEDVAKLRERISRLETLLEVR